MDPSPYGHRRVLLLWSRVYWQESRASLSCQKKGFYGPFPASCAISIDLRSHFHLSVLHWSAAFKGRLHRMAVISNVQYLGPEQEEQIEQVKISIRFLSLMEATL